MSHESTQAAEDDDESLTLPPSTLDALAQFYAERDENIKKFEDLRVKAEDDADTRDERLDMDKMFAEDWNASQFWYSDHTASVFARELLSGCSQETTIAVVSAPSAFVQMKNLLNSDSSLVKPQVTLLEYDNRFNVFKEFVPYDFERPLQLPESLKGTFDRIICDPPFLSDDCQTKAAMTVRWLSKTLSQDPDGSLDHRSQPSRLILCTGERMERLVTKLYNKMGLRTTDFEPQHKKGLSNEFRCYANYESDAWKWVE